MLMLGRWRATLREEPRQDESEIVRLHPDTSRRPAQGEAASTLADGFRGFGAGEDQKLIERDAAEAHGAIADLSEPDRWMELRRRRPRYIGREGSEGRRFRQAAQVEDDVVEMLAGGGDRHAERGGWWEEPRRADRPRPQREEVCVLLPPFDHDDVRHRVVLEILRVEFAARRGHRGCQDCVVDVGAV